MCTAVRVTCRDMAAVDIVVGNDISHKVSKQDSENEEDQPEFSGEKLETTGVSLRASVCGYWRDGPVVRNSGYSYRGPVSNSQHPHGDSQLSVTSVLGNPMASKDIRCTHGTQTYMQARLSYAEGKQNKTKQKNEPRPN